LWFGFGGVGGWEIEGTGGGGVGGGDGVEGGERVVDDLDLGVESVDLLVQGES
jgi:hypothetical protein